MPRSRGTTGRMASQSASNSVATPDTNPLFARLLDAYRDLAGLPVVLNTSFNNADEPIVCTPADAVRTLRRCQLDALVIGTRIVERSTAV